MAGMDLLLEHVPAAPLRELVVSAVGYRSGPLPGGVHRGLPSCSSTLVFELADELIVHAGHESVAAHGVLAGLHTRPVTIDASRAQEGVQYALSPLGLRALQTVGPVELRNRTLDLTDILGADGRRLLAQLLETHDWDERFRLVDDVLIGLLGRPPVRPEVGEAWRLITHSSGRLPIAEVAARVGWGRRHLSEQFRDATGLTPKEAARVARFEAVQALLRHPCRRSLVDIAAVCGYADQAHLSRDWREFSGVSMGTWLREELPFLQDPAHAAAAD